ncbi:hypothetical protein [Lentzea sp. E54]|uniref:hypothetical protein n=1 Tax=Lentzea xerophila TaxID=3435883 RepID=UPI003DA57A18
MTTAYRLLRSDWDVLLLTGPDLPGIGGAASLTGTGLEAARRLGLVARDCSPPSREQVVATLRTALGGTIRSATKLPSLAPDDWGVTAMFENGDDWFDLVAGACPGGRVQRRHVLVDDSTISRAIVGAELLGDALDIFRDEDEALRWWAETLPTCRGQRSATTTTSRPRRQDRATAGQARRVR